MYKLFIVDDEISARYGLKDCVDWAEYGIEVAGEADNGVNALQLISEIQPDIVITDVKMPKMDGIALSTELKRQFKHIKIIFISGYDEFEYLKSALQVEAVDYVLKPVNLKEMHAVIRRVVSMMEAEESQKKTIYRMHSKLVESMPLLREKFFLSILRDRFAEVDKLQERLDFLDLKLDVNGKYDILLLSVDDRASVFDPLPERERELTSFSVLNICQELIDRHFSGYAFEDRQGEYVCLLQLDMNEDADKLFLLIKEIQDNLEKCLHIHVTVGVGKEAEQLANLPQSYRTASEAVGQKLFLGKNRVIAADDAGILNHSIPVLDMEQGQKLALAVKTADEEGSVRRIDAFFAVLSGSRSINLKYCHNICLQLIIVASGLLMDLEIIQPDQVLDVKNNWDAVFKLETIEDMRAYVTDYYKNACALVGEKRNKRSLHAIEKVKDIIRRKYSSNLTINDIAREVYVSSTYLCLLFRQETGETLNEYLTGVRIDRAKELLMDRGVKLYDICFAVGYTDASYFTKIFKKVTGMTPSEFRDKSL